MSLLEANSSGKTHKEFYVEMFTRHVTFVLSRQTNLDQHLMSQ